MTMADHRAFFVNGHMNQKYSVHFYETLTAMEKLVTSKLAFCKRTGIYNRLFFFSQCARGELKETTSKNAEVTLEACRSPEAPVGTADVKTSWVEGKRLEIFF